MTTFGALSIMQALILSLQTSSSSGSGLKVKQSKCGHVAYQIKGKEV